MNNFSAMQSYNGDENGKPFLAIHRQFLCTLYSAASATGIPPQSIFYDTTFYTLCTISNLVLLLFHNTHMTNDYLPVSILESPSPPVSTYSIFLKFIFRPRFSIAFPFFENFSHPLFCNISKTPYHLHT